MAQQKENISLGCEEWCSQIPMLLDLPEDDEVRTVWERHGDDCPLCRSILEDEARIKRMFAGLPDPGPAFIAGRIMSTVRGRNSNRIPFRTRDIGWGLAGGLAGVVLGVWLASVTAIQPAKIDPATYFEMTLSDMSDEMDDLFVEVVDAVEESP